MDGIELHIEELVLHGFSELDRYRIGAAVESELARIFSERGLPPGFPGHLLPGGSQPRDIPSGSNAGVGAGGADIPRLDGGAFEFKPGARPEAIGAQIARAVYGGLTPKHGR